MSQPVQRFEAWPIKVAIFKDDYGYKISAQKSYKDKDTGEWKNTTSMSAAETLACAHLLTEAACWVMRQPPIQNQGGSGEPKPKGNEEEAPF